ncbi:MAG: hypothetical protein V1834_01675 [Candidatus Micrarchaeota archaeon]
MDIEDRTPKEAYLYGRLLGLNELVGILKDAMESGDNNSAIVQSVVAHIADEMNSVIADMKGVHGEDHPVLTHAHAEVKRFVKKMDQPKVEPASEEFKEDVGNADELMKSLLELRKANE